MNLEEKAIEYAYKDPCNINVRGGRYVGYIDGYKECLSDLKDFIKANPKINANKITEYLNSL